MRQLAMLCRPGVHAHGEEYDANNCKDERFVMKAITGRGVGSINDRK